MPVTLVDRLPLPNLKVYTAGSISLLSAAVYYALSVTSDPGWRVNATLSRREASDEEASLAQPGLAPMLPATGTRNLTEQIVDVMTFMMQEPLCMWSLINIAYCSLAVFGFGIQRLVFGPLRVAEAQRVKDKFWNYVFYKFIFVFGVINVQYMDEVLLWCSWFTLVGFLHLFGQLCKDRYEYLSSSPTGASWALTRLAGLLAGLLAASLAMCGVAVAWGLPAGRDTFAFMAAECILVLVGVVHVGARYVLRACDADVCGPLAYYTHLAFDATALVVELGHVAHMVVHSRLVLSMASLVLLMQLRHLLHELRARLRRHRLYAALATHMSRNYPMASKEEVEKNQDNCAICWEPMKEARKLPCAHLFHNSCLCQWVQQDASCPTCRRALAAPAPAPAPAAPGPTTPAPLAALAPHAPAPNHLFHFDGSRYVSWLPSFSVEVTRVRGELGAAQLQAAAAQLHEAFPAHALSSLAGDLARTRSPDATLDNILQGRLPPAAESMAPELPETAPVEESVPASSLPSPTPDTPVATSSQDTDDSESELPLPVQFPSAAAEREELLRRRKRQLLSAARKRYLQTGPRH